MFESLSEYNVSKGLPKVELPAAWSDLETDKLPEISTEELHTYLTARFASHERPKSNLLLKCYINAKEDGDFALCME